MKALGSRSSLGGIVLLGVFATVAVAGHLHGDSLALVGEPLTPPSATHPFGTDFLGRDLLARTGRGATTSALVAGASVDGAAVTGAAVVSASSERLEQAVITSTKAVATAATRGIRTDPPLVCVNSRSTHAQRVTSDPGCDISNNLTFRQKRI